MSAIQQYTEDQRDCLQEVVNVAMGMAGDSLARLLQVFVHLSIPRISTVTPEHFSDALNNVDDTTQVSVVRQGFQNPAGSQGLKGESLIVFTEASLHTLVQLLADDELEDEQSTQELLLDIANLLNAACLNGIAEQLEEEICCGSPSIMASDVAFGELLQSDAIDWQQAIAIEINYSLEDDKHSGGDFNCDLLLVMPDATIGYLAAKLDELLED